MEVVDGMVICKMGSSKGGERGREESGDGVLGSRARRWCSTRKRGRGWGDDGGCDVGEEREKRGKWRSYYSSHVEGERKKERKEEIFQLEMERYAD